MGWARTFLDRLLFRPAPRSESEVEEVRLAFKERYHAFKQLLSANASALVNMAEMESALDGIRPFGMTYVRASCTRIATEVWHIIRLLNELAPDRYTALYERFKLVQESLQPILATETRGREGELVLPLSEIHREHINLVGRKISNLGEIRNRLGFVVPDGFAVTVRGYERFMDHNDLRAEIEHRLQAEGGDSQKNLIALSGELQRLVLHADLPEDLEQAIIGEYRNLEQASGGSVAVAVRSSGLAEDMAGVSFAGQYHSELNVSEDELIDAYKTVIASKYALPAMTYRLNRGLDDQSVAMSVGVLRMVDARAGGVFYSRNPVSSGEDAIIVVAAPGLPAPVVEGSIAADVFLVERGDPPTVLRREIAEKRQMHVSDEKGDLRVEDLPVERWYEPSLSHEEILELARVGLLLETHYGCPQDIEWAIDQDGVVVVLQSRPLNLKRPDSTDAPVTAKHCVDVPALLEGGITASAGVAAGPPIIVRSEEDALTFPEGGVLVTVQSNPYWATILNRTAAVVCEQGSIAGHLASVAREHDVPTLLDVRGATRKLSGLDMVTVDADGRAIYAGRVEELLVDVKPPRPVMEGTPVYEKMALAAGHILPLNLLDPDAPDFKPGSCRTFHDITRFCHEKAVQAMFQFGKEHRFPERSSKQLFHEVPMQWWVLNLDDGYAEEVTGRYVHIENIVSIPTRALWDGIVAVPWDGPPPIDGRGFMSVMFGATTNTALNTGVRSSYADRNYIMLSRNYCCLSSRLGAHFSTVEALVSERTGENYISFQFKGGAADFDRRLKRVIFVKDILEENGFLVSVKEDHVVARLKGRDMSFMKDHLRILGYVTIHTRQLDMIMANPAAVNHYRKKIREDIRGMLEKDN